MARLSALREDLPIGHDGPARSASFALLFALTLLLVSGCTHVAPYERGKLAQPTMTTSDLAGPGEEHTRAIQEGATGGSFALGGGCGCN